jgi:outer membrane protein assembly factor BamB
LRDALIDLGEVPSGGPGEPETALPRPPWPYRWMLGLLTAVLAVLLGGGGPPPQPPPDPVVLPIALGDRIQADGDRLFVIGQPEPFTLSRTYTIQTYDLPEVTPRDTYRVTVPGDVYTVAGVGEDVLLVGYNDDQFAVPGLMAVRPGDGEPLWRRPANMYGIAPANGLLLIQEETAPGQADSRAVWRAVDPLTGTVRWSVEQPPGGQVTMSTGFYWAGYPARFYTVHGDGLMEARDGRTGVVTTTARLPRPPGADFVAWATAGLVMAGYGTDETIAYDEVTLAERWRRDGAVLPEGGYPQECAPVICLVGFQDGLTVLDPATGRELWHTGGYDSTEVIGDHVLVAHASQTEPVLAVLDPRTGRTTTVDGPWISGGPGPKPGTAWVYRHQAVGYALRYGILDLAEGRVHTLGQAERIAGDCQFTAKALVCRRQDSSIAIWRL